MSIVALLAGVTRAGRTLIAVSVTFAILKLVGMRWPAFRLFHLPEDMFNPGNVEFVAWIVWGWAAARYLLAIADAGAPARILLGWRFGATVAISLLPLAMSWYRIAYYFLHITNRANDPGIAI
jgi:hypothetical protein